MIVAVCHFKAVAYLPIKVTRASKVEFIVIKKSTYVCSMSPPYATMYVYAFECMCIFADQTIK